MALVGAVVLAGCGGPGQTSSTPALSPTTATMVAEAGPAATPAPVTFGPIVWAGAIDPVTSAPVGASTSFPPDAVAIYAVAPVKNVTPGLTVSAEWSFNGVTLSGVASTVVATQAVADGWIEFHLTLTAGQTWPAGTYRVVVHQTVGDSVHADVKVKLPTN